MDSWLKGLIAAACLVVIAGGGYYFWNEYRISAAREELRLNREAARNELFQYAGAEDDMRVRKFCENLNSRLTSDLNGNDPARILVKNCRHFGYL